LSRIKLEEKEH